MDKLMDAIGELISDTRNLLKQGVSPEEIARRINDPGGARDRILWPADSVITSIAI